MLILEISLYPLISVVNIVTFMAEYSIPVRVFKNDKFPRCTP